MARIRSIKPEFWTSEQVMECSPNARLMFIGMWNFADDCGRLPCSPKSIKAQIFPSDDIDLDAVRGMINELSSNGLVLIYSIDSKDYLQVTGWQHQRIDKPQPAKYPAPFFDESATAPRTLPPDRKGEDRIGKEKIIRAASPSSEDFENLKKVYPRRKGNYGWKAAERKFNSLVKTGVDPNAIIIAARCLAETLRAKIGTEFIPMPASWLNSEDFVEAAVVAFEPDHTPGFYVKFGSEEQDVWDDYRKAREGKPYPRDSKGGWRHPTQWPPGYEVKSKATVVAEVDRLVALKSMGAS